MFWMIYFFLVKHVAEVDLCLGLLLELLLDSVAVILCRLCNMCHVIVQEC